MSFVKKAIKKVFKVVKKVVKKSISFVKRVVKSDWFKIAAIVALSFFTAGLATGGFAMGSAGGLTGFFQGVGATISQGFTTITGALGKAGSALKGMFTGAGASSGGTAAASSAASATMGGTAAVDAAVAGGVLGDVGIGAAGIGTSGIASSAGLAAAEVGGLAASGYGSAMAAALGTAGAGAGTAAATSGFLSTLGGALLDTGWKGTALRTGISYGIQGYFKQKQMDMEEGYYRNRIYWGNAAYGSDGKAIDMLQPHFKKASSAVGAQEQGLLPFQQAQAAEAEQQAQVATFDQGGGGLLAGEEAPQQGGMGVPGQMTQAPPATQPQQQMPPGSQLENMGV